MRAFDQYGNAFDWVDPSWPEWPSDPNPDPEFKYVAYCWTDECWQENRYAKLDDMVSAVAGSGGQMCIPYGEFHPANPQAKGSWWPAPLPPTMCPGSGSWGPPPQGDNPVVGSVKLVVNGILRGFGIHI